MTCRCGYDGPDDGHPCHGWAYTCRAPANRRFTDVRLVALAGMQFKVQASDTWACDACWRRYTSALDAFHWLGVIGEALAGVRRV